MWDSLIKTEILQTKFVVSVINFRFLGASCKTDAWFLQGRTKDPGMLLSISIVHNLAVM